MTAGLLLAVLLAAVPRARAQSTVETDEITVDHEEWKILGWNDGCGVAFEHLYYPKLGEAVVADPISTRIGTAYIPVAGEKYRARWVLEADGAMSWNPKQVAKKEDDLRKAGYTRKGFPEIVQDGKIGNQPLLAETILSTGTLHPRLKDGWPGPEWRWAGADYNPLGTCAMLLYENRDQPRHYRGLLVRVYNSRVRTDRAYAHASNARLLFNDGDLDRGAIEARTAAELDPALPIARYENAAMLALTGYDDQSMDELKAAVKLDDKYAGKARDDEDFQTLRRRDDFQELTRR